MESLDISGNFEQYLNCDDELTCGGEMTDDDVIEDVQNRQNNDDIQHLDEKTETNANGIIISDIQMKDSLQKLYVGLLQRSSVPVSIFDSLNDVKSFLNK